MDHRHGHAMLADRNPVAELLPRALEVTKGRSAWERLRGRLWGAWQRLSQQELGGKGAWRWFCCERGWLGNGAQKERGAEVVLLRLIINLVETHG